jgi:phosphotransferase system IIA component
MKYNAVYDVESGRVIKHIAQVEDEAFNALNVPDGCAIYGGELDPEKYFVSDGEPVERASMGCSADKLEIKANGNDMITVEGVIVGSSIVISGPTGQETHTKDDDDVLEISSSVPGDYTMTIELFPFITETVRYRAY